MMKRLRILCLILCIMFLAGMIPVAAAEMSTLGVYFCGLQERADGTMEPVQLTGRFFVLQNGEELGLIQAGEESVLLTGTAPVTVKPVMSSMPKGWDIPEEGLTVVPNSGSTTTVPFMVYPVAETNPAPVPVDELITPEPAIIPEPDMTRDDETDNSAANLEQDNEISVTDLTESLPEVDETVIAPVEAEPMKTVVIPRDNIETPTPEPAATPVPVTPAPVDDCGTLLVNVFNDANNNGEKAKNEAAMAGVPVEALDEDGNVVAYAVSDNDGNAQMELAPGKYAIRVNAPQGWGYSKTGKNTEINQNCMEPSVERVNVSKPVQVHAAQVTSRGVGIWELIHVSGFCWFDVDGDGVRAAHEEMLAGVRIVMKGQKNGLTYETTSDNEGNWFIGQVKPGFYDLYAYVPEGMVFTRYSRVGGNNRSIFTTEGKTVGTKVLDTNDGLSVDQQNIGFMPASNVTGMCFLDANYNGIYDEGEEPLSGVKVQAYKASGDLSGEAFSDESGLYTLRALRGNTYSIRCVLPEKNNIAFTRVAASVDGNRFRPRAGFRETTIDGQIVAPGEEKQINVGAIFYGSIGGLAYIDKDFSGTMNGKESIVTGLTVSLADENGKILSTVKTNGKGRYIFEKLTPGVYQVQLAAKDGYAFTKAGEGNAILNTSGGNGKSEWIHLALGAELTNVDAGMIIPGTVTGVVFADANDDGRKDGSEQGMEGMTVHMLENGTIVYSTTVTRDGNFKFDAVMPGTYRLRYELPERGIFAKVVANGNTMNGVGYADTEEFNIGSAGSYNAPLCGVLTLGEISGTVFRDSNGNGVVDNEESPVEGVTIRLAPTRDDLEELTVTTAEDGNFILSALHPDEYILQVVFPEGSVMSRTDEVKLPIPAGTSGTEQPLTVAMGQMITEQKVGCVIPASLNGCMWLDENNNGRFDDGEKTPEGQIVTVIDEKTGNVFAELTTDENGHFGTSGMIPGSFTVSYNMDSTKAQAKEGDSTFILLGDRLVMNNIELYENENRNDLLLGIVQYTSMGGRVWMDEQGEIVPLMNATVTLLDAEGETIQSKVTEEDGQYIFTGLMPGQYGLTVTLPGGGLVVLPDDERLQGGLISVMTVAEGREGKSGAIELKMGEDLTGLDIGSVVPGELGDFCWLDLNGNGWQDAGELGVPGVRISLIRDGKTVAVTESDAYGFYRFAEVYPATYSLQVTPPAEVKPTVKKNDIPVLVSVLTETDDVECFAQGIVVTSNKVNFNADLGFVPRKTGIYPTGYGKGPGQKWN